MRLNKKKKYTSTDVEFWVSWFRTHKQIAPDDPVVYGWLPNTMSTEELIALKVASDKIGAVIKINRRGAGEVILLPKEDKEIE